MGARHLLKIGILALTLGSCRPERCRDATPAFELQMLLPAGVDGARVAEISVEALADGQRRSKVTIPAKGELGDGQSSLVIDLRNAGSAGFVVDLIVEAYDSAGHLLARGQASFAGSSDACNFFSLALSGTDAGVDARAEAPCRADAECADTLPCTEDTCTSLGCIHPIKSGLCLIGGACVAAGELNPDNPCERCDPSVGQLSFTFFMGRGCVTTIAGSTSNGGHHLDGPAMTAEFDRPADLVVDSSGTLFVADMHNSCIRSVSGGVVSTIAGIPQKPGLKDGPGSSALFSYPSSLALSPLDGLLVMGNNTIRRVDLQTLAVSTLLGDGTGGFADGPAATAKVDVPGQAAAGPGGIYLADDGNHRIRLIASDAVRTVSTVAGSGVAGAKDGPAATAEFYHPGGLAVLDAANLLVADTENHRIRQVRTEGGATTVVTLAGSTSGFKDGPGAQALFARPVGLAVSGTSSSFVLYVADPDNHRIRMVTSTAGSITVSTLAGDGTGGLRDGPVSQAQFSQPWGVALDSTGRIHVADTGNSRIRLITPP